MPRASYGERQCRERQCRERQCREQHHREQHHRERQHGCRFSFSSKHTLITKLKSTCELKCQCEFHFRDCRRVPACWTQTSYWPIQWKTNLNTIHTYQPRRSQWRIPKGVVPIMSEIASKKVMFCPYLPQGVYIVQLAEKPSPRFNSWYRPGFCISSSSAWARNTIKM